jgi:hypothetical protein
MVTSVLSLSVWLCWRGVCARLAAADEQDAAASATRDNARAAAAADYVRELVAQMQVRDADGQPAEDLKPQAKPLLSYNDLARGYLAAGVWRLGEHGRPEGLVSVEYWLRNGDLQSDQPYLSYEFISLAGRPFELVSPADGFAWRGDGKALEFVPLPDGPAPAESTRLRLTQMKSLLRRVTVKERFRADTSTLRMLPQPIDRYEDRDAGIVDGAAFVFAYGTNPELLLLLECDASGWRFGLARMSWAETVVELDGAVVRTFEHIDAHPTSGAYQTAGRPVGAATRAPQGPGQ